MDNSTKKMLKDTLTKLSEKLERKMVGGDVDFAFGINNFTRYQITGSLKNNRFQMHDESIISFSTNDGNPVENNILYNKLITVKEKVLLTTNKNGIYNSRNFFVIVNTNNSLMCGNLIISFESKTNLINALNLGFRISIFPVVSVFNSASYTAIEYPNNKNIFAIQKSKDKYIVSDGTILKVNGPFIDSDGKAITNIRNSMIKFNKSNYDENTFVFDPKSNLGEQFNKNEDITLYFV